MNPESIPNASFPPLGSENNEEDYKALYHNAPIPYQSLDADGKFIEVNAEWLKILGYSRDEVIGKYFGDFLHPDWQIQFDKNFPVFKKQGFINGIQFKVKSKIGEYRLVSFEGRIGNNVDGSFRQTYCVFQDITDKQLRDDQFHRTQYYLRKAQEIGKIGTWELDVVRNELTWTEENYKVFGVPIGTKLNYEIFLSTIHPDDRDYVNRKWTEALEHQPYDIEHRLLVNGEVKWVREKADVEFDENGKATLAIGVTQDITFRKKSEKQLTESEDRYRLILDNSLDAIITANLKGEISSVNKAACEMFGLSEAAFVAISVRDVLDMDDTANKQLFADKREFKKLKAELIFKRNDNTRFAGEVSSAVFEDKNGREMISMIIRDVTERKKAENDLRELKNKLQVEVERKTRELKERVAELERFQDATVEREFRIKELKAELEEFKKEKIQDTA